MRRLALLVVLAALACTVAGCGGQPTYTLAKSKSCLTERGIKTDDTLDFVAQTANGGAFNTELGDNSVEVIFGLTEPDAKQLQFAYQRVAFKNVQAGLSDVLRRYHNAVTLWHAHPGESDLALIVGCLR